MKKKYRIKKNEEFSEIINLKHSKADGSFVLYFNTSKLDYSRVGISVSRKLGNAVERNKIKRQVREMIKDIIDFDNFGLDLIIIVRKGYLNKNYIENKNDLEIVIKNAII